jgi:hypothetical protein
MENKQKATERGRKHEFICTAHHNFLANIYLARKF